MQVSLEDGDVVVWYLATENVDASYLAEAGAVLSPEEALRRDRLRSSSDRRDYAAAHALLRWTLSRYGDFAPKEWRFVRRDGGKPALDDVQAGAPPLEFSLTHTRGLVACAVTRGAGVGIDVECDRAVPDAQAIAARHFSESEVRLLAECAPSDVEGRFLDLWTLKEAYAKATGLGLRAPLSACTFTFDAEGVIRFSGPSDAERWQFHLTRVEPTWRLALAVRHRPGTAPCHVSVQAVEVRM